MTETMRTRCRHAVVIFLLVASVAAIGAARLAPTAVERCVDDAASSWNGTGSELWAECVEQVGP
jgi:opacity protein-like surface antigen